MKEAFLQFEVEVVKVHHFEDIVNCATVIIKISASCDTDIVHVYANSGTKWFVFEDNVTVYEVHHGLKGCWRIGKSEIHDCRFEEAVSGFERCLLFVSLTNAYVIIPPSDVELRVEMCIAEIADEIRDEGKRVLIPNRESVDLPVILYQSELAIFFLDEEK